MQFLDILDTYPNLMHSLFSALNAESSESSLKHVGPNVISIHGFFGDAEVSKEELIPFATCEPPILFIAGTDDKMCPSAKFVSKNTFF